MTAASSHTDSAAARSSTLSVREAMVRGAAGGIVAGGVFGAGAIARVFLLGPRSTRAR